MTRTRLAHDNRRRRTTSGPIRADIEIQESVDGPPDSPEPSSPSTTTASTSSISDSHSRDLTRPFSQLSSVPFPTGPTSPPPFQRLVSPESTATPPRTADDPSHRTRRGSLPFDCQELSEQEKSERVKRSKKLDKILGTRAATQRVGVHSAPTLSPVSRTPVGANSPNLRSDSDAFERATAFRDQTRSPDDPVGSGLPPAISRHVPSLSLGHPVRTLSLGAEPEFDLEAPSSPGARSTSHLLGGTRPSFSSSVLTTDEPPPALNHEPTVSESQFEVDESIDDARETRLGSLDGTGAFDDPPGKATRRAPLMHRSSSTPSVGSARTSSFSSTSGSPPYQLHASHSKNADPYGPYHTTRPRGSSSSSAEPTILEIQRDERRKKLEKVRRMLGDRVPVDLVVHAVPSLYEDVDLRAFEREGSTGAGGGGGVGGVGMNTSRSRQVGERIKEVLLFRTSPPTSHTPAYPEHPRSQRHAGDRLHSSKTKDRKTGRTRDDAAGTQSAPARSTHRSPGRRAGMGSTTGIPLPESRRDASRDGKKRASVEGLPVPAGKQGVDELTKARKLESLFGDLPPRSLYLSTPHAAPMLASSSAGSLSPRRTLFHRRSHSDLGTAPLFSSTDPWTESGPKPRSVEDLALEKIDRSDPVVALDLIPTRSNSSSLDTYRKSIASLRYVMEEDPEALDDIARRVYHDDVDDADEAEVDDVEGPRASGRTSRSRSASNPPPGSASSSAVLHPSSLSSASWSTAPPAPRAELVRKAQKLSSFFGTTRGEVWKRLLDDLRVVVEEDEALEDDERSEVLIGLERLRKSGKVAVGRAREGLRTERGEETVTAAGDSPDLGQRSAASGEEKRHGASEVEVKG
ncbi:hypothetical protein JCM10212_003698 [Sporobolomyces blumeae]